MLFLSFGRIEVMADEHWPAQVLPSERYVTQDEATGAELVFATRSEADDINAYFHQRSWFPDESVLFFVSNRTGRNEVFGYIEKTGELIRLQRNGDGSPSQFTAGIMDNALYFVRDKKACEWRLQISLSSDPASQPSKVEVEERCFADLPPDAGGIIGVSESCDGQAVVTGFNSSGPRANRVVWIDKKSGVMKEIMAVDYPISHIQCSWETPGLICFARSYSDPHGDRVSTLAPGEIRSRIHCADLSDREPWPIYPQELGELVTHECWWVRDQITFCSGQRSNGDAEESHVKVYDPRIDRTYIIGAGSWWEGCTPEAAAKVNYWHAAGSPDGRFVAGDNWHGIVALFNAKTARTRILTQGHRIYGKGAHPHAGWSPSSEKLVFASNRFGNPDVCIVKAPEAWRENEW